MHHFGRDRHSRQGGRNSRSGILPHTKDKEFKRKAVLYSNTVLMFFLGALLGVTGVAAFGNALGACVGFIPLAVARIFISIGELPVEDETPEETEEEAEEMMEEAKILEKEEKKKI